MKTLIFLFVALTFASTSFAAASGALSLASGSTGVSLYGVVGTGTAAAATDPLIGKCSTGVGIGWNTTAAGYSIVTQHKSGSKVLGTSFDSTSIYSKEVATVGTTEFSSAPTTTDTTDFTGTGWRAL